MRHANLKSNELLAGYFGEVAPIARGQAEAVLKGATADEQIVEGDNSAPLRCFGMDLADEPGCIGSDRIDRHRGFQVLKEGAAGFAALQRVSAIHSVSEFRDADCT